MGLKDNYNVQKKMESRANRKVNVAELGKSLWGSCEGHPATMRLEDRDKMRLRSLAKREQEVTSCVTGRVNENF